jgi:alcohol dehydrogenase class IV
VGRADDLIKSSGHLIGPFEVESALIEHGAVAEAAVIGLPEHGRKVSLRDDRMLARIAIIDPALTDGCPRAVTLASGLDAVSQVIEPWISCKATPYTDALTRGVIGPGLGALARLMQGEDASARDAMAWCSVSGGLALANGGLGAVHGLAGVIGGRTGGSHGAICGVLLGPVLALNRTLTTGAAHARIDEACQRIADVLGGTALDAPVTLSHWARSAGLPSLTALGLAPADHAAVAEAALSSSSTKGNPCPVTADHLKAALEQAA